MKAYCVKCKSTEPMANSVETKMENGRKALKGKCATCGTGMFKILGGKAKTPAASSKPASSAAKSEPTPAPAKPGFRLTFFHD
jgi:Domain of unknown function (DUF5679)